MAQMLSLKIDVTKIDKARLYQGQKGTYLDCVVFLKDEPDQYGNVGMITQSVSKEEREAGTKGAILGNARPIGGQSTGYQTGTHPQDPANTVDDIPW